MSRPAASAIISGPRYFDERFFTSYEVEAEPALCAAEVFIAEDMRGGKEVRFDVEECINTRSSLPEKHGDAFIPGPAYLRKCVAARVNRPCMRGGRIRGELRTTTADGRYSLE